MKSLTWYVRVEQTMVGTVIAQNKKEALDMAFKKFPFNFEDGIVSVEQKSKKRKCIK